VAVLKGYSAHLSIHIDPSTAVTRWCGEPMDYDLAVFALFSHRDLVQNVSAETSES
jgi:hypothetical protein